MKVPVKVDAEWIASLADAQLVEAEAKLHTEFVAQEEAEKRKMGSRYTMLRGPEPLVSAWLRWLLVNNETQARGVVLHRKRK